MTRSSGGVSFGVDGESQLVLDSLAEFVDHVGGEDVYPAEVEDALYEHPDVAEAVVVAAPHEVKGQAPVAFVVLESATSEGSSDERSVSDGVLEEGADVTERDLREFTLDHVASYAHPRRVFFHDELPRSATQKVQRYKLEKQVEEHLDGPLSPTEDEL